MGALVPLRVAAAGREVEDQRLLGKEGGTRLTHDVHSHELCHPTDLTADVTVA